MTGLAKKGWDLVVDQSALSAAAKFATRKGAYAKIGRVADKSVRVEATPDGICLNSSNYGADVPGIGVWQSPIVVDGPMLAALSPKLSGPTVRMQFRDGALFLNTTRIGATRG